MKRRVLTSAMMIGGALTSHWNAPRSWAYLSGPTAPLSPTLNRERQCSSCRVGIVSGTKCFACSKRRLK